VEIVNKLTTNFPTALYAKYKFGIKNHTRTHTSAVHSILPKIQLGMFSGKIGGVTPVSLKTQSFLDRTYTCTLSTINTHKYTQNHKTRNYTWFGQYCLHPPTREFHYEQILTTHSTCPYHPITLCSREKPHTLLSTNDN
jgi:hypothetical protein